MNSSIFKNDEDMIEAETKLLKDCNLVKKNDRVYYSNSTPSIINKNNIILLKEIAKYKGLSVCRICMHTSDSEIIHEMLMIHTKPHYTKPLKQNKKSLSYHVIEGFAELKLYDDSGVVQKNILIGDRESDQSFIRLDSKIFRSLESKSDYFIFLEVASGPFKDSDTIWMDHNEVKNE